MTLPRRLLIANRGEIACRIARTARRLDIETVAVHSDADADALHVAACDRARRIGGAAPADSYLNIAAVIEAARDSGADAVHPGYGFLSENAAFAEACLDAGLVFVGPPAAAIRSMGSKSAAKALMAAAGVPVTPGYHGADQSLERLQREADRIGYPLLIKASAGGGGKGMRRVDRAVDFGAALQSCEREARAAFGDGTVLLERYVLQPRHIEIQVFADSHGHCLHLFERDCSVQRRHQKVLEEAPAPGMSPERRASMGSAAVAAARAVGYVGAGTVEFIVAPDGEFHFMEMNTRLQVEHPVTEMITGLDLVEWQLRVAGGEALPFGQEALVIDGHAIEARIYAEDAQHGFLPSTGRLAHVAFPAASAGVRVDTGVGSGSDVTPYYDAMLAKLIVHDRTREAARARLERALGECRIVGVTTNLAFLQRLVTSSSFASAALDTALIEREHAWLFAPADPPPREAWLAAALAWLVHASQGRYDAAPAVATTAAPAAEEVAMVSRSPWCRRDGWRMHGAAMRHLSLSSGEHGATLDVRWNADGWRLTLDGAGIDTHAHFVDVTTLELQLDGARQRTTVIAQGSVVHVFDGSSRHAIRVLDPYLSRRAGTGSVAGASDALRAPMPGRVVCLLAVPGRDVERGAALLVLEAMKMEHTVAAPSAGRLERFRVAAGEQVAEGDELVVFHPAAV